MNLGLSSNCFHQIISQLYMNQFQLNQILRKIYSNMNQLEWIQTKSISDITFPSIQLITTINNGWIWLNRAGHLLHSTMIKFALFFLLLLLLLLVSLAQINHWRRFWSYVRTSVRNALPEFDHCWTLSHHLQFNKELKQRRLRGRWDDGREGEKERRNEGTRKRGNEGTRERGNEGTRERGRGCNCNWAIQLIAINAQSNRSVEKWILLIGFAPLARL